MEQPAIYTPEKYEAMEHLLLPVYTLPKKGLSNQLMLKAERSVLEEEHLFRGLSADRTAGKASAL